jgi:probable DNA metabolism protein
MKTPENFMDYLAAHRDCNDEIIDYARMLSAEDIDLSMEPKIARIRRMISAVRCETHKMMGFIRLVPLSDSVSYGYMEPEHDIGKWVAASLAHRFPNTQIVIGNHMHTWSAQYSDCGLIYSKGVGIMQRIDELKEEYTDLSTQTETQKLWTTYYISQYSRERKNPRLFQKNMPEKHIRAAGLATERACGYRTLASFC